jgi:hypothetical protein
MNRARMNNKRALALRTRLPAKKAKVSNVNAPITTFLSLPKPMPFISFNATSTTNLIYSPGANLTFECSSAPDWGSFSAIYDEFRVQRVDLYVYRIPESTSSFQSRSCILLYAPDRDAGSVPATIDEFMSKQQLVRRPCSSWDPVIMAIRAQKAGVVSSEGYIQEPSRWYDVADASSITFCVGVFAMLKNASTPEVPGLNEYLRIDVRPVVEFKRRR